MKRTPMKRGTRRVGQAARERIAAGGVLSKARHSLSRVDLDTLRRLVFRRDSFRCPVTGDRTTLTLEHAVNRSQGGRDSWSNTWAASAQANERKMWAYAKGRLVVEVLGEGLFRGFIAWGPEATWEAARLEERWTWGRKPSYNERAVLEAIGAL